MCSTTDLFYESSTKMSVSYRFVLRGYKSNDPDPSGFIHLRTIENRKKSYKSLGLPKLKKRFWDDKRQQVKKHPSINSDEFNQVIERTRLEFLNDGGSVKTLNERTDNRSFLNYVKNLLNGTKYKNSHGTRIKYMTVVTKLEKFLKFRNKKDLLFNELTIELLDDFQSFMVESGMTQNSVTHYLKILKSFVQQSCEDRTVMNTNNPFQNFKFKKKETRLKETLTNEEIDSLVNCQGLDSRLNQVRLMFLFQFFTGGMRVSDLLTLRFKNLKNGNLSYRMMKTKHPIEFGLSDMLLDILSEVHPNLIPNDSSSSIDYSVRTLQERSDLHDFEVDTKDLMTPQKFKIYRTKSSHSKGKPLFLFLEEGDFISFGFPSTVDSYIKTMNRKGMVKTISEVRNYLEMKGKRRMGVRSTIDDGWYESKKPILERFLELLQNRLNQVTIETYDSIKQELTRMGTQKGTENLFVFGRLDEDEFKSVINQDNFSNIPENLYKKINRSSIVYNRNLKELQIHLGLTKTLKSHLPRVSFTNLMMKGNVNHRDISNTLGHSSISITDVYLKTGFTNDGVDSIIKGTSQEFKNKD